MNAPAKDYHFLDSETQSVSQTILVGLGGPTGAGKTESAIRIARGIVGERGDFCVIDTENKRALNKKKRYRFKHLDLQPPYSPENYEGSIRAAIKAGFRAVVVDSFSPEWEGEGGLQDDATEALERMAKGDAEKAEKLTALAWKGPKQRHKKLMAFLRKCEVPVIFGLRAEPKIKFKKDDKGKMQVIDAGWLPIAEKMFGYDMLIYALMMAENPGVPVHLKKLEPDFEPMFPVGKQITEECGRQLAAWAAGGIVRPESKRDVDNGLSAEQIAAIKARCKETGVGEDKLLAVVSKRYGQTLTDLSQIKAVDYEDAMAYINSRQQRGGS